MRDPMLLNLAAWKREEDGDYGGSLALLGEARALAPRDPTIIGAIGAVLRKQGNLSEAVRRLDEAIRLDPTAAAPWLERGMALETGGSLEPALESYRRASELDPGSASAFGGVASIASRRGDLDIAEQYGSRALSIDPLDPPAAAGMARTMIERREPAKALAILAKPLATELADENLANLSSILGDAFDRLGRTDEAFTAYLKANQASARRLEPMSEGMKTHREFAERLLAEFSAVQSWPAPDTDGAAAPAFLIGYPRSGTTLLENILASIPGIEALEERPTLAAGDEFLRKGGMVRLAAAETPVLERLRKAYWDYVANAGIDASGKLFLDKDPLKGLTLPLIARLFPAARIIVMRRDPRDVVFSCFRANFAPTAAAAEFTDLNRSARHYDAFMRSQEAFLAALPLARHELRYEALVGDLDGQTQGLCDFLGIAWTDNVRDFAQTARRRGVSTLSASQVGKKLYDGSRQWERYADHLAPVLPILEPWVERFGYHV